MKTLIKILLLPLLLAMGGVAIVLSVSSVLLIIGANALIWVVDYTMGKLER